MQTELQAIFGTFQRVVTCVSLMTLACLGVGSALYRFRGVFGEVCHRWWRLDAFGKWGAVAAVSMMVMYGGAKHGTAEHAGADDGIALAYIGLDVTNVVESASVTNTFTEVDVAWTNGTVTAETPVHVRMSNTNEWRTLTKIGASTFTDSPTNHLYFTCTGDVTKYPYWWVGSNPPAVIIEVVGITLTKFVMSSHAVLIAWTCDDARAVEFVIECCDESGGEWTEVARTSEKEISIGGFFIDRTTRWRVYSVLTGEGD